MAKNNRSASTKRGGCLPMLVIGAAMCLLVIVNGFVLNASLGAIAERLPEWLARPKLLQSVAFVMPVFMTVAEWWLVDQFRAVRAAAQRRREANRAHSASE